ncbi:MAG: HAD family hydrolase [Candidatus Rhabdochlamydia sp.]
MYSETASLCPSIKMVLFDHDDTLVGTCKAKWAQHKYIARTFYGKELQDDELRLHWGKPFTLLLELLYETDHVDIAMSYNIATRSKFPKVLFKNTIETLNVLRNSGKKLGLLTATNRSSLEHDLKTLRIPKKLFDYVQAEDDTEFHKPDSRVFDPVLTWMAQQDIQSHEVLYVGDHLNDMIAARDAGMGFIGVGTGLVSIEEFKEHRVKGINQLADLVDFLRNNTFPIA